METIFCEPFSPKNPPTTPPTKAPTNGMGIKDCPNAMPAKADPNEPTAVTDALPIYFIFSFPLVAWLLKVW